MAAKDKIILALDVPDGAGAHRLIEQVGDRVGVYKVGLQLFIAEGPDIVRRIQGAGGRVFLDLKLHDIPNTVARAAGSACAIGVEMFTIHLAGGGEMIRSAVAAPGAAEALVLGVTVLTSSTRATLAETGADHPVEDQVLRLTRLGVENGIRGVVASPQEISLLRQVFGAELKIVTPGVRPEWAGKDDQARVLTPAAAIKAGADYLVIGRPITAHSDPGEAATRIAEEIAAGV